MTNFIKGNIDIKNNVKKEENYIFDEVVNKVKNTGDFIKTSASTVFIIHKDKIVTEKYFGQHSHKEFARKINCRSRFNVASVRKSYIGFAVAYALLNKHIHSIDDYVISYLPNLDKNIIDKTTIRHLLTHTHGLASDESKNLIRNFPCGTSWEYTNDGIKLLTDIVETTTGKTVSQILRETVFNSFNLSETDWETETKEDQVSIIFNPEDEPVSGIKKSSIGGGYDTNLYVSSRELAYWGYIHLKKGTINEVEVLPKEIFDLTTSLQSPYLEDRELPENGFLWWVKTRECKKSELGELVPKGSYQILGNTGSCVLVIPSEELVAVRMYNKKGNPKGYDYLRDVKDFGNTIMKCLYER